MADPLDELVGLMADPKPEIRKLASENLVPYSLSKPSIFKTDNLKPIGNLKLLIKDIPQIAEHFLTILINLSADSDILDNLVKDEKFMTEVLRQVTVRTEPNANLLAMLLANLAKSDLLKGILERKQSAPEGLGSDDLVMNQLLDLFVKGGEKTYNKDADYDHLSYLFADLSKHAEVRQYFVRKQEYDGVLPFNKLKVFTDHKSDIRRKGVASTIKNVAFDVASHPLFLAADEVNLLPYILLPIMGPEEYEEEDMMEMLPEVQMLPAEKRRDPDPNIIETHLDTLLLLTTSRKGREHLRDVKAYPIVRETHLQVRDQGVKDACERLVQVLMRDEADNEDEARVEEIQPEEEENEDEIVEV